MSILDGIVIVARTEQNGNLNTTNPIPWEYDTYVRTHYQSYRPPPSSNTNQTKGCELCDRHSEQREPNELHQRYYTCILDAPRGQIGVHEDATAPALPLMLTDNHRYLAVNVRFTTCDDCHYRILEETRNTLQLQSYSNKERCDEPYLTVGKDRNEMLERARQMVTQLTNQEN